MRHRRPGRDHHGWRGGPPPWAHDPRWHGRFDLLGHFPRAHPFVRHHVSKSLQRRLFLWFGATILVTAFVVFGLFHASRGPRGPWPLVVGLLVVWIAAGFIARRLARPIHKLALVADEIGQGQLESRGRIPRHHPHGEVRVLADALFDMATRIDKQLKDQRALLATVSHELRTPLAHMRLLVELARSASDKAAAEASLDELDREVVEIDALVGDLLANSRLDFAAISPLVLDAAEVAAEAVERANVDVTKLVVDGPRDPETRLSFRGDPTLVARALVNLLENAERHAGGVARVHVYQEGDFVVFDVEDNGPGFLPGEEQRAFEPFYRNPRTPAASARSTGLGLALVARIASAHGGDVYAKNLGNTDSSGARVGLRFPLALG